MKTAMLWFDNDPKTDLRTKIERAAAYYAGKYRQSPNLVHIHPSMATECHIEGVTIVKDAYTLPNHLWVGLSAEER